jgi:uncharacterized protein YdhG (YjbR/CyaY superfamily)
MGQPVTPTTIDECIAPYPPVRDPMLRREASGYAGEKGNLRFPLDEPIPYALIARIAKVRAEENQAKRVAKRTRGKSNV